MAKFKRVFVIVIDSVGIGEMPDAERFGDKGTNTFVHTSERCGGLNVPIMNSLGLGELGPVKGTSKVSHPHAYCARLREASNGKDTMTGHWEMMGIYTTKPFVTFTDTGFKYTANEKKWSVGINLDELTGVSALKDLEINIYGNSQEKFSKLSGTLKIEAMKLGSLSTKIGLDFDVTLENTNSNVNDWSSSIQNKFNNINSISFPDDYLNNPEKYVEA